MAKKKNKHGKTTNWLLISTILVFLIPGLILGFVLLDSVENTHEPVVENRFKNQLDPKISEEQVAQVKAAMQFPEVDKVEVNLISGTLRVNLDFKDNLYPEQIQAVVNQAYDKVNQILPIKTYFTNHDGIKMYDLEIHGYDIIPKENDNFTGNPIYYILVKTGAAKEPTIENVRVAKNQEISDQMLRSSQELMEETQNQEVVQPDNGQPLQ